MIGWQDLADIIGLEVERPQFVETTALGAAICASVGAGINGSLKEAAARMRGVTQKFVPDISPEAREARLARYHKALSVA